ncbi:hypothetical protein [Nonomuraea aurantiaca]|uniref:hypothetical protein n=1 Tax=Nonomuraea aurantiaca TaxID=2878562 RepID=UPI001CD9B51B|nr:hypothetical protein [Nonomuraea aurantiaca]MCA2220111.1 hypothetical protein [Nonomuraea aurantiaca]
MLTVDAAGMAAWCVDHLGSAPSAEYSIHGRIMDAGMIVTVPLLITVLLFQRLRRSPAGLRTRVGSIRG